jgi:hypothetical protein
LIAALEQSQEITVEKPKSKRISKKKRQIESEDESEQPKSKRISKKKRQSESEDEL